MIYTSFWFRLKNTWHCIEAMQMEKWKYKARVDGRTIKDLGILAAVIIHLVFKTRRMIIDDLQEFHYVDDIKITEEKKWE